MLIFHDCINLSFFEINDCLTIDLNKRIPVGAGLGGGSSDAAATLRALNRIYKRATKSRLLEMAAELGSDVPFCIDGLSAFCSGRGEILRPTKIKKASDLISIRCLLMCGVRDSNPHVSRH